MTQNLVGPPRLATGSHPNSSLYMCGMNVISWENGDTSITDTPDCTPVPLAKIVHAVNDTFCSHTTVEVDTSTARTVRALCAECAPKVLELAHRTVGLPEGNLRQGWAWIALMLRDSLRANPMGRQLVTEALRVAQARAEGESVTSQAAGFWPIPYNAPPALALANEVLRTASMVTLLRHAGVYYVRAADTVSFDFVVPTTWYPVGYIDTDLADTNPFAHGGMVRSHNKERMLANAHRAIDLWQKAVPAPPAEAPSRTETVREPVPV